MWIESVWHLGWTWGIKWVLKISVTLYKGFIWKLFIKVKTFIFDESEKSDKTIENNQ